MAYNKIVASAVLTIIDKFLVGKQQVNMLDGRTKWLHEGRVTDAIIEVMDRNAWNIIIICAKEQGTLLTEISLGENYV